MCDGQREVKERMRGERKTKRVRQVKRERWVVREGLVVIDDGGKVSWQMLLDQGDTMWAGSIRLSQTERRCGPEGSGRTNGQMHKWIKCGKVKLMQQQKLAVTGVTT